jgi:hypothetical protein
MEKVGSATLQVITDPDLGGPKTYDPDPDPQTLSLTTLPYLLTARCWSGHPFSHLLSW